MGFSPGALARRRSRLNTSQNHIPCNHPNALPGCSYAVIGRVTWLSLDDQAAKSSLGSRATGAAARSARAHGSAANMADGCPLPRQPGGRRSDDSGVARGRIGARDVGRCRRPSQARQTLVALDDSEFKLQLAAAEAALLQARA